MWLPILTRALCFVFDCYVIASHTLICVWLSRYWFTHSVFCLIVTWLTRALCFLFECYVINSGTLFYFLIVTLLTRLLVTLLTRALSFLFDCYLIDSRTLFYLWFLRYWFEHSVLCCLYVTLLTRTLLYLIVTLLTRALFCVWLLRYWLAHSVLCLNLTPHARLR